MRTMIAIGPSSFTEADKIARAVEWAVARGVGRIACTGSMEKYIRPLAERLGVVCKTYPAEYRRYGPPGAIVRNVHMLEDANPDMVFGFTDTLDENTVDLLRRAAKAGVPTYLVSTTVVAPPEKPPVAT
jgi:hypothetical protein